MILGVGSGSDRGREYSCFAEVTDDRQLGAMLDEGLEILASRKRDQPFDVAFGFPGLAGKQPQALLPAYAAAGATWWLECFGWITARTNSASTYGGGHPPFSIRPSRDDCPGPTRV